MSFLKHTFRSSVVGIIGGIALLLSSCSSTSSLEPNEQLYIGLKPIDWQNFEPGSHKDATQEELEAAADQIMAEFNTWEGCVMKEIKYTDDQKCEDNLSYINSLAVDTKYDECIVFTSTFHSPVEGGDAWEPDYDYGNWEWYLGRTDGGDWDLLTWGY